MFVYRSGRSRLAVCTGPRPQSPPTAGPPRLQLLPRYRPEQRRQRSVPALGGCRWSEGEDAGHWSVTGRLVSVVRGRGCRSLVGHWSVTGLLVSVVRGRGCRSLVGGCRWSEGEDAGHWSVTGLLMSVVRGRGCRSLVGHWSAGVGGQRERMPVTGLLVSVVRGRGCRSSACTQHQQPHRSVERGREQAGVVQQPAAPGLYNVYPVAADKGSLAIVWHLVPSVQLVADPAPLSVWRLILSCSVTAVCGADRPGPDRASVGPPGRKSHRRHAERHLIGFSHTQVARAVHHRP